MVFKLNFLSDCRLTMSQASSTLYSPATTCSKKWSKTLLTIQIIWNIGMNQESNLIKIPKAKFFTRPNVQLNVQLRPIEKNSASVISSARLYWTLSWIKNPTWLDTEGQIFFKAECSAEFSASADCEKVSFGHISSARLYWTLSWIQPD